MSENKQLKILYELSNLNSSALNEKQLLNITMQLITGFFKAEVGVILFFDEDKYKFFPEVVWGMDFDTINSIYYEDTKLIYWILSHDTPVLINDFFKEKKVKYLNQRKGHIQSIIGAKLKFKDKLLGAIFIANKTFNNQTINFDESDVELFKAIVGNISVAVYNNFLYDELLNVKNFISNIINSLNTGVITTDDDLKITTANKSAELIFNVNTKSILNKKIDILFRHIKSKDKIMGILKKRLNEIDVEAILEDVDGNNKILNFSFSILTNSKDEIIGNVITIDDISEKKALENQIAQTEQLAALGELAAGIAHEIKNPLTAIKGFAQILPNKLDDKDFLKKFSNIITEETSRLNNIIEGLLEFSRPASNKMKICNINIILDRVLSLLSYQIEKANIKVNINFKDVADIIGEEHKLEQVFLNIILNAVQAIGKDGSINVSTKVIIRRTADNIYKEYVLVEIIDTGPGINDKNLKKLFNPFFTTKTKGTGLGLAISHRIISEHNGIIEVNSRENEGTTFLLYFPTVNN